MEGREEEWKVRKRNRRQERGREGSEEEWKALGKKVNGRQGREM